MKSYLVVCVLLMAIALGGVVLSRMRSRPVVATVTESQAELMALRSVQVLGQGDEFDLELADGRRIHGRLEVRVVPNAKKQVVRIINASKEAGFSAKLLVKDNKAATWMVDLYLRINEKNMTLSDWLCERKLIWEQ